MELDCLDHTVFLKVVVSAKGVKTSRIVGGSDEARKVFAGRPAASGDPPVVARDFFYHWLRDSEGVPQGVQLVMRSSDIPPSDLALLRSCDLVTFDPYIDVRFRRAADGATESDPDSGLLAAMMRERETIVLLLWDNNWGVIDGKIVRAS